MGSHAPPAVPANGSFTGPTHTLTIAGVLSDFDGTIVDSTAAIVKHWHDIAVDLKVDPAIILATSHGRRSIDTLQIHAPHLATQEYVTEIEAALPRKFGNDATVLPGASDLLAALGRHRVPWAIVTSGTRALMDGWVAVLKLQKPGTAVTAEEVTAGKPDPACYVLGLQRIGLAQGVGRGDGEKKVLVLEDAPAGVKAGKAAGCFVLGLATTHAIEVLVEAGADWVVKDLESLQIIETKEGGTVVEIRDTWVQK